MPVSRKITKARQLGRATTGGNQRKNGHFVFAVTSCRRTLLMFAVGGILAWRTSCTHRAGLLLALCVGVNLAWSQNAGATPDTNPIGKVLTITGTARIDHSAAITVGANLPTNGIGEAKVGDFVYRGDIIQTGSDGAMSITLADGSAFNVSNNAKMEVNDFVYDPNGHSNSSLLSLTKGTFTFIAGNIAHTGSMKVDTPVGTMGIRGTAPRVEILSDGSVKFSTLIEKK